MRISHRRVILAAATAMSLLVPLVSLAQQRNRPLNFVSAEVSAERKITFRIHAPKAETIRLTSDDIPGNGRGAEMTKGENDVWEVTIGPVPAGAYRYRFSVDGLAVNDPRNPKISESVLSTSSLVDVPGSDVTDLKEVPHGAVAQVAYHSSTLMRFRRMHVYTPPGYERGDEKYPVLYLLHGAGDSDASWSTIGRAGIILDNLIAAGKAKPMLVVMPAGHAGNSFFRQGSEFEKDFTTDLRPYIESHYRVIGDRAHRAIAGLSMGGAQSLNIAFGDLKDYGYLGVFSSGVFGIAGGREGRGGGGQNAQWEDSHKLALDDPDLKKDMKLVWFGCGKDDFLLQTSNATVKMLTSHGFPVTNHETAGGHTWMVWRDYLHEFAPLLFADAK